MSKPPAEICGQCNRLVAVFPRLSPADENRESLDLLATHIEVIAASHQYTLDFHLSMMTGEEAKRQNLDDMMVIKTPNHPTRGLIALWVKTLNEAAKELREK